MVIAFLLLGFVVAIGRGETGAVEKVALLVIGVLLVAAAASVRRRLPRQAALVFATPIGQLTPVPPMPQ